ncbi:MAG: hypothetical protein H0V61_04985 [Chitinophagales bacterium]|nr:hypothetical protein [Chitinophagales bacterium]
MKQKDVMAGFVSVTFKENDDFNIFCARVAGYNAERFEAVALRFFTGEETIITIYARDKSRKTTSDEHHLAVHKFKILQSMEEFFKEIRQMNFTISNSQFDMWDMEVTNK